MLGCAIIGQADRLPHATCTKFITKNCINATQERTHVPRNHWSCKTMKIEQMRETSVLLFCVQTNWMKDCFLLFCAKKMNLKDKRDLCGEVVLARGEWSRNCVS